MDETTTTPNPRPLIEVMKKALRREGITYAQLAPRLGLSEASIKRLFSQGRFTLAQVLAICAATGTELADLAGASRRRAVEKRELSLAQERALADEPRLLLLFHLLAQGRTTTEIARDYQLRGTEATRLLAQLDRLKLIDWLPGDRVRLKVPRDFAWRSDGPVRRRFGPEVLKEFLLDRFRGERALLRFEVRELSEASLQLLKRKLEKLAHEVAELAELDAALPSERRISTGIAVAIRPWVYSLATALKAVP